MDQVVQDIRYGFRMLRKNPGFALTAILILAVGIGANTAVFSMVDRLLLKPLPYPDADRLVLIRDVNAGSPIPMSYPKFLAWRKQKSIFEQVGAYFTGSAGVSRPGDPQQFPTIHVSTEFLPLLGVNLYAGRGFTSDEEVADGPPAVIISYPFWQSRFAGNHSAVGEKMTIDDKVFTVVGILPKSFRFETDPAFLLPLRLNTELAPPRFNFMAVLGKFPRGYTLTQVQNGANAAMAAINQESSSASQISALVIPLQEFLVGNSRPLLLALLGTVSFVLLIACANMANLLLARAASREKEIAIRISLGSARIRLVRQLLTESVLLSLLGGVLGLMIAWWGVQVLTTFLSDRLPRTNSVSIDISALAFTAFLSIVTGVLFGLAPALQAGKGNLPDRLKQGGRVAGAAHSNRLRSILVVAELTFSLVLLAGTGLLLRSFIRLMNVDKGFDSDHVLTMHLAVSPVRYTDAQTEAVYLDQIVQRTRALPGVESAGMISNLPFSGNLITGDVDVAGAPLDPDHPTIASKEFVSGDYFKAMHIPLVKGRYTSDRDNQDAPPVAVVDKEFVRRFIPKNEDPIGKRVDISWGKGGAREIVGVVGEAREMALATPPLPTVYTPIAQKPELLKFLVFNLAVRTKLPPLQLVQSVTNQIHQLDSTQIVANIQTMDDLIGTTLAPRRAPVWLFGVFSVIALFLAAIGIYGVLSYYVIQRRQEIGTRMALGAQRSDILKLILKHAGKLVLAGVVIGLIAAFGVARALTSLLFGVQPTDLPTFLGVAFLLAMLALLACSVPALRATRVDPLVVLRDE